MPDLRNFFRENSGRELLSLGLTSDYHCTQLRVCALSIKPFSSTAPKLSMKNWENEHYAFGHLSASDTRAITETVGA